MLSLLTIAVGFTSCRFFCFLFFYKMFKKEVLMGTFLLILLAIILVCIAVGLVSIFIYFLPVILLVWIIYEIIKHFSKK